MEYKYKNELEHIINQKGVRDLIDNLCTSDLHKNVENFVELQEIINVNTGAYSDFVQSLLKIQPDLLSHFRYIPKDMFLGMKWLENIEIPSNIRWIDYRAFALCSNLEMVTFFPGNLSLIGNSTFFSCSQLKSVYIPRSVRNISNHAFEGCDSLVTVFFDEDSRLEKIDSCAFACNKQLLKVMLPNGLKKIKDGAFMVCKSLKEVYMPDSVIEIDGQIFDDHINSDVVVRTRNPYVIDYCTQYNVPYTN